MSKKKFKAKILLTLYSIGFLLSWILQIHSGEFVEATIRFKIDIFISYKPLVCVKSVSNLEFNL